MLVLEDDEAAAKDCNVAVGCLSFLESRRPLPERAAAAGTGGGGAGKLFNSPAAAVTFMTFE